MKHPIHVPSVTWLTNRLGTYPNYEVHTNADGEIEVVCFPGPVGAEGSGFRLSRRHARLLAKRLHECLDQTQTGRYIAAAAPSAVVARLAPFSDSQLEAELERRSMERTKR